jgi:hypothetical protein
MSFHSFPPKVAAALLVLSMGSACSSDSTRIATDPLSPSLNQDGNVGALSREEASLARNAVFAGNAQSIVAAPSLVPAGAPLAPFIEARLYAIANVAMHDALNGIVPRFARYADNGPIDRHASAAAAVLTAAHDAIVGATPAPLPGSSSSTDDWYASAMAALGAPDGLAGGKAIGHRAARAILAKRASDGVAAGGVGPYYPGSNPGDYRFTSPFDGPPFSNFFPPAVGFADASNWAATVTPFVITSASQFRPGRPYGAASNAAAVMTRKYTEDFNEVKALGCAGCTARSTRQSEIALFWKENSPTGWNRIARTLAEQQKLDAVATARLFALLQMGEFDAYTSSLEAKYYYNFWRPVTAVALAETDGNPHTSTTAGWEVEGAAFPTPPVPDYPSAHATAGGNAAAIIEALMPGRGQPFSTTSGSLPAVTRTFSSVAAAAEENALSRIYIGYHFRHATKVGVAQGRAVGEYIAEHALRPLNHDDDR